MAQEKPPAKPTSRLSEMFRRKADLDGDEDTLVLSLPSVTDRPAATKPRLPVPDLSAQAKLWLLIGAGSGGKTLLARWLGDKLATAGTLDQTMLAALDPTNRTLAEFFGVVEQPASANPARVTTWLREFLTFVAKQQSSGIVDFGGNNTSLMHLVETSPTFADPLDEAGVAAVAAYLLSPRVDDLTLLAGFEGLGFRPKATALILNLGRAESQEDFDAVRRHPAYKAALARGAVELWLPKLEPQSLALEIERKRLHFTDARDGITPEGRKPADISLLERVMIRAWLGRMDEAFAPVSTWLPWAAS
jgi:hypothetical protein